MPHCISPFRFPSFFSRLAAMQKRIIGWIHSSLMARTCHSLKLLAKANPRCPEAPNATRCSGNEKPGVSVY